VRSLASLTSTAARRAVTVGRGHAIVQAEGSLTEDELRAHLGERLVSYKLPRTFELVTEPVRDDAGKVRRSALRDARTRTA
jgi:bile acid-coenzyme A ligase